MRRFSSSWNAVLSKLGLRRRIGRKQPRAHHGRFVRLEGLEPRYVLAAVTVSTLADLVDSPNMSSIAGRIKGDGSHFLTLGGAFV